eukprot:ANDGO_03112.mRNA.1 hypothetical protein
MVQQVEYKFNFPCTVQQIWNICFADASYVINYHTFRHDTDIVVGKWLPALDGEVAVDSQRIVKFTPANAVPQVVSKLTGIASPHCVLVEKRMKPTKASVPGREIVVESELGFEEASMAGFKQTNTWCLMDAASGIGCDVVVTGRAEYVGKIWGVSGMIESSMLAAMKKSFVLWGQVANEYVENTLSKMMTATPQEGVERPLQPQAVSESGAIRVSMGIESSVSVGDEEFFDAASISGEASHDDLAVIRREIEKLSTDVRFLSTAVRNAAVIRAASTSAPSATTDTAVQIILSKISEMQSEMNVLRTENAANRLYLRLSTLGIILLAVPLVFSSIGIRRLLR